MLRDIVVHIPVEQSAQPVIDCAVSIGSIFDAHIDGIACVYPTFDPLMAFEASAANVAALTAATQSNTDKAASALDQFEIAEAHWDLARRQMHQQYHLRHFTPDGNITAV